jgi:hypothetical protein
MARYGWMVGNPETMGMTCKRSLIATIAKRCTAQKPLDRTVTSQIFVGEHFATHDVVHGHSAHSFLWYLPLNR